MFQCFWEIIKWIDRDGPLKCCKLVFVVCWVPSYIELFCSRTDNTCSVCVYLPPGGNQRELARAKNMKKQQEAAKKKGGAESGVALRERKERFVLQMKW